MYFSNLAWGAVHPPALYGVRILVLLAVALQMKDSIPSTLLPALWFFTVFSLVVAVQYVVGPRVLEGWMIGSVYREATFSSFLQLIFYFLFFIVGVKLASQKEAVERLASAVTILALILTIWGIMEKIAGKTGFGPFINENHFGGFVALTLPLTLQGAFYRFYRIQKESLRTGGRPARWGGALGLMDSGALFLLFVATLVLAACFFSEARTGALVTLFSFLGSVILFAVRKEARKFALILTLVLGGSFLILQKLGWESIWGYFASEQLKSAWFSRLSVVRESLNILYHFPFFGCGLGTYYYVSSKFVAVGADWVVWDHAHNDYVELLAETGTVGFLLFGGILGSIFRLAWKSYTKSHSHWVRSLLLQAAISIFGLGVLEGTDFHLKIPSLALLFTLQLAILFQASQYEEPGKRTLLSPSMKRPLALAYAGIGIFLLVVSTQDLLAYSLSRRKGDRLENLERAVRFKRSNSEYWYQLGLEHLKGGSNEQAVQALRKAVQLSPTFAHYQFFLGRVEIRSGYEDQGIASLEKAVRWSPARAAYLTHLRDIQGKKGSP